MLEILQTNFESHNLFISYCHRLQSSSSPQVTQLNILEYFEFKARNTAPLHWKWQY